MIVCVCHRVSDHTIRRCGREGACFEQLQFEHGVATQCGQCECRARQLLDEAQAECQSALQHAAAPQHSRSHNRYPVIPLQAA